MYEVKMAEVDSDRPESSPAQKSDGNTKLKIRALIFRTKLKILVERKN